MGHFDKNEPSDDLIQHHVPYKYKTVEDQHQREKNQKSCATGKMAKASGIRLVVKARERDSHAHQNEKAAFPNFSQLFPTF